MTPVLYILCRNDLASLNPGKMAAQVAHAGMDFILAINREDRENLLDLYNEWLRLN